MIVDAGYGPAFRHRLGHGVGRHGDSSVPAASGQDEVHRHQVRPLVQQLVERVLA